MLAMIAHPEQQKKCQDELDNVVGRFRMPTLKDQDSLPYLRATVRELLRWRPIAPLGRCPLSGIRLKMTFGAPKSASLYYSCRTCDVRPSAF